jgi:hypothetical protein
MEIQVVEGITMRAEAVNEPEVAKLSTVYPEVRPVVEAYQNCEIDAVAQTVSGLDALLKAIKTSAESVSFAPANSTGGGFPPSTLGEEIQLSQHNADARMVSDFQTEDLHRVCRTISNELERNGLSEQAQLVIDALNEE